MEKFSTHNVITEEDYLQYYMHTVSTTKTFKKQRSRLRIFLFIFVLLAAVWSIVNAAKNGQDKMYIVVIVWVVVFPLIFYIYSLMEKKKYTRFFKKYIETNHKENMIKGHDLEFDEDHLTITFTDHNLEMLYADIIELYQNQNGIYIKNKNESSFIFPSNAEGYGQIKNAVSEIAAKYQIPYQQDENWKWK